MAKLTEKLRPDIASVVVRAKRTFSFLGMH